jgi:hypothetical protein
MAQDCDKLSVPRRCAEMAHRRPTSRLDLFEIIGRFRLFDLGPLLGLCECRLLVIYHNHSLNKESFDVPSRLDWAESLFGWNAAQFLQASGVFAFQNFRKSEPAKSIPLTSMLIVEMLFQSCAKGLLFSTANVIRSEVPLHDVDTLLMSKIGDPQSRPFVASSP